MYLLFTLSVEKELAPFLEEEFYNFGGFSWETEEKKDKVYFKFYFPITLKKEDEEKLRFLEGLSAKYQGLSTEYALVKEENWEEIWKYHFKPLRIGKRLVILPPWEEPPSEEGLIPIYIDPGQAFGTGHHPTTQLVLENLEIYLEEICKKEEPLILDMGCGTGILGIASILLCPRAKVFAIDIDELALFACKKNAEINQVLGRMIILKSLPEEDNLKFHLILANIGFKELRNLSSLFLKVSLPKKTILLLSGVLKEDLKELKEYYESLGFQRLKTQISKGWSLLVLRAP